MAADDGTDQAIDRPAPAATGREGWRDVAKRLGLGLVAAAADNDPTTVATLAVLGASTVYGLAWLVVLLVPMLAAVQITGARVGAVTGQGLQQVVRATYGRAWGLPLLASVLAVNLLTLGADLAGGAAALGLLFAADWRWFVGPFALAMALLLLLASYRSAERLLKYVPLVFLAYVGAAFVAHPDWRAVLHATLVPSVTANPTYVQGALALLGTTLSSYAYVWETIEEAEERPPLTRLGLVQVEAGTGMALAVAVFWFILIGTGATLGVAHRPVETAQDAAQALRPVAGALAEELFALGLLASAILAVPVLAASSAYVAVEELGWRQGLSEPVRRAPGFYAVIIGAILLGVAVSLVGVSPIRLLFWSGIAGGLATPVSLVFLLLVARNRCAMGGRTIGLPLLILGWTTTAGVAAVGLFFVYRQLAGA